MVFAASNHRDDLAGRVESTFDSCLTDLDAAWPCIVYADRERGRERATAVPLQRTGAYRAHTYGAKRRRSRRNCLTADADHGGRGTRNRHKPCREL